MRASLPPRCPSAPFGTRRRRAHQTAGLKTGSIPVGAPTPVSLTSLTRTATPGSCKNAVTGSAERSQLQRHRRGRRRAAHQHVIAVRLLERRGGVLDGPGEQSARAGVADPLAAAEADRDVARLREVEQDLELRIPR